MNPWLDEIMTKFFKRLLETIYRAFRPLVARTFRYKMVALGERNTYNILPVWTTLDISSHADIQFTFTPTSRLPFEDDSVHVFYNSHNLEHLSIETCRQLFSEINRCLRPGGHFLIDVPDCMVAFDAYRSAIDSGSYGQLLALNSMPTLYQDHLVWPPSVVKKIQTIFPDSKDYYTDPIVLSSGFVCNFMAPDFMPPMIPTPIDCKAFRLQDLSSCEQFVSYIESNTDPNCSGSGGHQTGWFLERIAAELINAGFRVKERNLRRGITSYPFILNYLIPDRAHRSSISLYIAATKP